MLCTAGVTALAWQERVTSFYHELTFVITFVVIAVEIGTPRLPLVPGITVAKGVVQEPTNDPVARTSIDSPVRIPLPHRRVRIAVYLYDCIVDSGCRHMAIGESTGHVRMFWLQVTAVGADGVVSNTTFGLQTVREQRPWKGSLVVLTLMRTYISSWAGVP